MSENRRDMSERDSRMESASSAFTASTAVNPASSTISTARIRSTISSSTTRTFGGMVGDVMTDLVLKRKAVDDQVINSRRTPVLSIRGRSERMKRTRDLVLTIQLLQKYGT